jgi:hypothetical protein
MARISRHNLSARLSKRLSGKVPASGADVTDMRVGAVWAKAYGRPVVVAGAAEHALRVRKSACQIDSFRDRFMIFLFYHWNSG